MAINHTNRIPMEIHHVLVYQQDLLDQKAWTTTAEAGFPLEEENEEIRNKQDDWEGKKTDRFLHPSISNMAQYLNGRENQGQRLTRIQRPVTQLDNEWMNPANESPRREMASEMKKKKPSSQSERPTPNQGLSRKESKTRINVLLKPPTSQHLGTRHHPHRNRIKNMDRPL